MRSAAALTLLLLPLGALPAGTPVDPCPAWGAPREVGVLDARLLREASGLAVSRRFAERLYHVNDSGDGPRFYVTDLRGGAARAVTIEGYGPDPLDTEALSLGPCPGRDGASCLYMGDIGDNAKRRASIRVVVVEEQETFGAAAPVAAQMSLVYPDGPHNAEGLAVHPSGDLFILTKEERGDLARPAELFRLRGEHWARREREPRRLEALGQIDLPALARNSIAPYGRLATALDIAPDGSRFLVLTYRNGFEFLFDPSAGPLKPTAELVAGRDWRKIDLVSLPQQEAIAYLPDGRGFLYESEMRGKKGALPRLMRVDCATPADPPAR